MTAVPNDNITMGALVDLNLRVVVWPEGWRSLFYSTYDPKIQPGATVEKLLDDFMAYANGQKVSFLGRGIGTGYLFQVLGSAKFPDFSMWNSCPDPICKAAAMKQLKEDLAIDSVKGLSTRLNAGLLQDDARPPLRRTCHLNCGKFSNISITIIRLSDCPYIRIFQYK